MRKTKRRVLRSKRRALRSKRRKTQRKFKYQRGGETDDDLIRKLQPIVEEIEAIQKTKKQQELEYEQKRETTIANIRKTIELRQEVYNAKKPGRFYNNPDNMIRQAVEKLKIAEEDETALREDMRLSRDNLTQNINTLSSVLKNKKQEAVLLLLRIINNHPKEPYLGARQLKAEYSKPESEYSFDTDAENELYAIPYKPQIMKEE
jgi:DNA-binding transcriptional regulator YiaG